MLFVGPVIVCRQKRKETTSSFLCCDTIKHRKHCSDGAAFCPICGKKVKPKTVSEVEYTPKSTEADIRLIIQEWCDNFYYRFFNEEGIKHTHVFYSRDFGIDDEDFQELDQKYIDAQIKNFNAKCGDLITSLQDHYDDIRVMFSVMNTDGEHDFF